MHVWARYVEREYINGLFYRTEPKSVNSTEAIADAIKKLNEQGWTSHSTETDQIVLRKQFETHATYNVFRRFTLQ